VTLYHLRATDCPRDIVAGPDGALWFDLVGQNALWRITTAGQVTHFPIAQLPLSLGVGPDGALWVGSNGIVRVTTDGTASYFGGGPFAGVDALTGVASGRDGRVWFADANGELGPDSGAIEAITTAVSITSLPVLGRGGTELQLIGAGFLAGETVAVKYSTGLPSPRSVILCTGTADGEGSFSCNGPIPTNEKGTAGTHTLTAIGRTSGVKAATTVLKFR
jgi:hypothetical protein